MMQEPRRRSAESSRRRRREKRHSREDLASMYSATTNSPRMPGGYYTESPRQQPSQSQSQSQPQPQQPLPLQQQYQQQPPPHLYQQQQQQQPPPMADHRPRASSSSLSSSTSSSSSYLDISRTYPLGRFGGIIKTFIQAPSEVRRRRRRRGSGTKRRRGVFSGSNSSVSSINSDMAYGTGFIKKEKVKYHSSTTTSGRGSAPVPGPSTAPAVPQYRGVIPSGVSPGLIEAPRDKTDEEILEIGRQLSDLARRSNEEDLRAAGKSKPSMFAATAAAMMALRKSKKDARNRGLANSKKKQSQASSESDDSDWEDASDDDDDSSSASSSDDANSNLAYGDSSHALVPVMSGAIAGAVAGSAAGSDPSRSHNRRKSSVVNPALFGPINSLRGLVNTPCGFGDDKQPIANAPILMGYPVPTSDPNRFNADQSSIAGARYDYQRHRPDSVPIEQPVPKQPVSSKVYQTDKFDNAGRRDSRNGRRQTEDRSVDPALAGVAAAAAAAAARMSDRRGPWTEDRIYRDTVKRGRDNPDDERETVEEHQRDPYRDIDRQKPNMDSYYSKYVDKNPPEPEFTRQVPDYYGKDTSYLPRDERTWMELDPEERRETLKYNTSRTAPKEPPRTTKAGQNVGELDQPFQRATVDPFQYQVADDAFNTPLFNTPRRPLTPQVVTVDRVPNFDDSPPKASPPDVRLSRKDSFEIEREVEERRKASRGKRPQAGHEYEEREREASLILNETRHSTIPVAAAAIASAIAVEKEHERRDKNAADGSNGTNESPKDEVQKEADKYYRESVVARKIAADQVRSGNQSPEDSVVDKWEQVPTDESFTIVTPPEEEEKGQKKSPYDGPNADVIIDNEIYPHDIHKFLTPDDTVEAPAFTSQDPSCERERPVLNLVRPTPVPSPVHTPSSEGQERQETEGTREVLPPHEPLEDVILGPKGEVIQSASNGKSVTWGENSTKSYEVESPETSSRAESPNGQAEAEEKPRPRLSKTSQWGKIAAALAGSSSEPVNELDRNIPSESRSRDVVAGGPDQVFVDDSNTPPVPGPKPADPKPEQMPGGYADDIEFAATLAAGLKDSGFDPNIVIDNPTYRRRDSAPGANEATGDPFVPDVTTTPRKRPVERSAPETPNSRQADILEGGDSPSRSDKEKKRQRQERQEKRERLERLEKYLQMRQSGQIKPPPRVDSPDVPAPSDVPQTPPQESKRERRDRLEKFLQRRQSGEIQPPPMAQAPSASPSFETASPSFVKSPETPDESQKERRERLEKFLQMRQSGEIQPPVMAEPERPQVPDPETTLAREAEDIVQDSAPVKKSKGKKRRSRQPDDGEVSTLSSRFDEESTVSARPDDEGSRLSAPADDDSDWDEWDSSPRSLRRLAGSDLSVRSSRSNKSRRRSGTGHGQRENGHNPPDPPDDRGISSVVSEPRNDDRSSRHYDDDDTKSALPHSSRKSKDSGKKQGGFFSAPFSIFKSNDNDEKRDSFLGNAGTLGAGAGLASAVVAVASASSRSHAADNSSEKEPVSSERPGLSREFEDLDPEIAPRAIKPAIDPQWRDLLLLPPSEPGSPREVPEELPGLPDSLPGTPPDERNLRDEYQTHRRQPSSHDTPIKTHTKKHSNTAIPLVLRIPPGSNPSSPSTFKPSSGSPRRPATPESAQRRQPRPTSWDSSKEFIPLKLVEHIRQSSTDRAIRSENLPPLSPSETPREAPSETESPGQSALTSIPGPYDGFKLGGPLQIQTDVSSSSWVAPDTESQATTPKADIKPEPLIVPINNDNVNNALRDLMLSLPQPQEADAGASSEGIEFDQVDYSMSKRRNSFLLNSPPSSGQSNETIDAETVVQSPSTPTHPPILESVPRDSSEDSTSVDEHFSDALETARESPSETPADDVSLTEPLSREIASDFAAPPAAEGTEEKHVEISDAASVDTVVEPLPIVVDSTRAQEESISEPATSQEIAEEPKKGKKGKKNKKKKKSISLEPDVEATASAEPSIDATVMAPAEATEPITEKDTSQELEPVTSVAEVDAAPVEDEIPDPTVVSEPAPIQESKEPVVDSVAREAESTVVVDTVLETPRDTGLEAPEEPDNAGPSNKKSKKKKKSKGKAASAVEKEPVPEPGSEGAFLPAAESIPEPITEVAAEPTTEVAPEPIGEPLLEPAPEVSSEPLPESSLEQVSEAIHESSTAESRPLPEIQPIIVDEPHDLAQNDASDSTIDPPAITDTVLPVQEEGVPTVAEDAPEVATSSKKSKKKKKGKTAASEESVSVVPEPQSELVSEAPPETVLEPVVESVPEPISERMVEPASESAPGPISESLAEPVAEPVVEIAPESTVNEEDAQDAPMPSKKDKKKKKKKSKASVPEVHEQLAETAPSAEAESTNVEETRDLAQHDALDNTGPGQADPDFELLQWAADLIASPVEPTKPAEVEETASLFTEFNKDKQKENEKYGLVEEDTVITEKEPEPLAPQEEPSSPVNTNPEETSGPLDPVAEVHESPLPYTYVEDEGTTTGEEAGATVEELPRVLVEEPAQESVPAATEEPVPVPVEEPVPVPVEEPVPVPVEEPVSIATEESVPTAVEEPIPIVIEDVAAPTIEEPSTITVEEPVTPIEEPSTPAIEEPSKAMAEESTPATTEEPVSTSKSKKKKKKDKKRSTQSEPVEETSIIPASSQEGGERGDQGAEDSAKQPDLEQSNVADIVDDAQDQSIAGDERLELTIEAPVVSNKGDLDRNLGQLPTLESHITENLFSQGDGPSVYPTQDSPGLDTTQTDEGFVHTEETARQITDEPIETAVSEPAVTDAERVLPEAEESVPPTLEPEKIEEPSTPLVDTPIQEAASTSALLEETGKKSKKKKKKKKGSVSFDANESEQKPDTESKPDELVEPSTQDDVILAPVQEVPSDVPSPITADEQSKFVDEWLSTDKTTNPDLNLGADSCEPSAEEPFAAPDASSPLKSGREEAVPSISIGESVDSNEPTAQTETVLVEPTDVETVESIRAVDDQTPENITAALVQEPEPTPPTKMSKKEKRQKKKQAALEESMKGSVEPEALTIEGTTSVPEEPSDLETHESEERTARQESNDEVTDSAVTGNTSEFTTPPEEPIVPDTTIAEQSSALSQELELNPQDEQSGFGPKMSEDEESKITQDTDFMPSQDPETVSTLEPELELNNKGEMDADEKLEPLLGDIGQDTVTLLDEQESTAATQLDSSLQTESSSNPQTVDNLEQEPENREEEDPWGFGLSKKAKKQSRDNAIQAESTKELDLAGEAALNQDTVLTPEIESTEAAEDDTLAPAASKKDKRKKKKSKRVSQVDDPSGQNVLPHEPVSQGNQTAGDLNQDTNPDTDKSTEAKIEELDPASYETSTVQETFEADVDPAQSARGLEPDVAKEAPSNDAKYEKNDAPAESVPASEASHVDRDANVATIVTVPDFGEPKRPVEGSDELVQTAPSGLADIAQPTMAVGASEMAPVNNMGMPDTGLTAEAPVQETTVSEPQAESTSAETEPLGSDQQDIPADNVSSGDVLPPQPLSQDPEAQETMDTLPKKKLSKKEKRKKKKQQQQASLAEDTTEKASTDLVAAEPEAQPEPKPEELSPAEPEPQPEPKLEELSPAEPEAQLDSKPEESAPKPEESDEMAPSQEPAQNMDEPTKKMSKKEKKKAKKLARSAAALADSQSAESSQLPNEDELQAAPDVETSKQQHDGTLMEDTVQDVPALQPEILPAESETVVPEITDDPLPVSDTLTEKETEPRGLDMNVSSVTGTPAPEASSIPTTGMLDALERSVTEPAPPIETAPLAEDESVQPTKKKGKKGKKGKSGLKTPVNEPEPEPVPPVESEETVSKAITDESLSPVIVCDAVETDGVKATEAEETNPSEAEESKLAYLDESKPSELEEPQSLQSTETVPGEPEVPAKPTEADDSLASGAKKESKMAEAGSAGATPIEVDDKQPPASEEHSSESIESSTAVDQALDISGSEPAVAAVTPETSKPAEEADEPALPSKKKKGKGKKAKAQAASTADGVTSPDPEGERAEAPATDEQGPVIVSSEESVETIEQSKAADPIISLDNDELPPVADETTTTVPAEQQATVAPVEADDDDQWGVFTSWDKSKDNKQKSDQVASPESTTRDSGLKSDEDIAAPERKLESEPHLEKPEEKPTSWGGFSFTGVLGRFGGGKKAKDKPPIAADKEQPKEDSFLGRQALRQSGDEKSLRTSQTQSSMNIDFLGEGDGGVEFSKDRDIESSTGSGKATESEADGKEGVRHASRLDDDFVESPILGRGDMALTRLVSSELSGLPETGLLRRDSGVEELVGGLLQEATEAPIFPVDLSEFANFRRTPSASLPAVQEDPAAEAGATTQEANRDSGFAEDSPDPLQRQSNRFLEQDQHRDSGVHTWESAEALIAQLKTPEPGAESRQQRRPRRSTLASTPRLWPPSREATPDPEKPTIPGTRERVLTGTGTRPETPTGRTSPRKGYGALTGAGSPRFAITPTAISAARVTTPPSLRRATQSPPLRSPTPPTLSRRTTPSPPPTGTPSGRSRRQPPGSPSDSHAQATSGRQSPATSVQGQAEMMDPSSRPDAGVARRSASNSSLSRRRTPPEPLKSFGPESPGSVIAPMPMPMPMPTPPLRRTDRRVSGDIRALRQQNDSSTNSSDNNNNNNNVSTTPVANEGRVRSKDMPDVYDGYGQGRMDSPRSPTRPHSMRRRQSTQVIELEAKVQQLTAENRQLSQARASVEQHLHLNNRVATALSERDAQIDSLKRNLEFLRHEVARLTEVNEGLTSANAELAHKDDSRYVDLQVHPTDDARSTQEAALKQTIQEKDAEIADLHAQLDAAKDQIVKLQRQILDSKAADAQFLNIKDEDYFDHRCQQLCSHVQQWVLRFSKFSDMRACRLTSEINDEKIIDRLDNAILDGSDVDRYLNDRVRRRDVFMSVTMNMIWEFVFTRYLFGMDREQRQKLKSLEKVLTDVGPPHAVRQWRAVTLTLLSKRDSFRKQRELDTEAVVQAIYQTLCKVLPPPSNLEAQIQSQLRRVMHEAVQLSIEMRVQKAEYMMLPPLQPEYDADGELVQTVQFNASMMNERSGSLNMTNEELEAQGAIVRTVLFPLVVKKGDDNGMNDEEIVVCPAQVLIARSKLTRQPTPSSDGGRASGLGAPSRMSGGTNSPEANKYTKGGI